MEMYETDSFVRLASVFCGSPCANLSARTFVENLRVSSSIEPECDAE